MLMDSDVTGMTNEQLLLMRTAARYSDEHREAGKHRPIGDRVERAWGQLASLGLIGIAARLDFGGLDGSCMDEVIVAVAIGRGVVPIAYSSIAVMAVHLVNSLPQGATILPEILSGDRLMAVADEEPGAFLQSPPSTLLVEQDGAYGLRGRKCMVMDFDRAAGVLVTARDQATDEIVIVRVDAQSKGLRSTPVQVIDGRTAHNLQLDIQVDRDDILLCGREAAACLDAARDRAVITCAAESIGVMRGALALTREHLRARQQFGKPLATLQALRHRFADMAIEVECAESAVFAAARSDADPAARGHMASIAKAKCASAGLSICEAAIQLHGGLGMTNDYRIGQYYKRILVLNALHGSRDEHLDLLAKRRDASPDIRVS